METACRWGHFDDSEPCPIPKDISNPTDTEKQEAKNWDREDQIARNLLNKRLPDATMLEVRQYKTAKERWHIVTQEFTAKSAYARNALHRSFVDMWCLKGGDVWAFLTNLKMCRNKLLAAGVTINNKDFERTVLNGIPDALSAYASQTLTSARLNGNTLEMKDIIHVISEEADRMRIRRAPKDQSQGQSKANGNKEGHLDEALAATSHSEGGNSRRCRGKCHHCGKEGHWVRKCRTKKQEEAAAEAAAATNQSGQAAQTSTSTSTSPNTSRRENRPVGSANVAYKDDSDDGDFWAATVEVEDAHTYCAASDPLMGDDDDEEDPSRAEPCGAEDDNALGWAGFGVELTEEGEAQVDEWEAFRAETWGAEDEDDLDCAALDGQPVKEGEETDVEEEAEEGTPHSESQLAPRNALHARAISNDQVPHRALDDEGHTPLNGDGRPQTTSSCGVQVADTAHHAHCLHNVVRSPERTHLNDPEPAICAHEGQAPGFNANAQAHQAPWPRPGTVTDEQDVHPASAAQLKGEGLWVPSTSSEQTAAPGTPLTSNAPILPALPFEATPSSPKPAPELDSLLSLAESAMNAQQEHVLSPSQPDTAAVKLRFDPDPQPGGDGFAHSGTHAPHLAPSLQRPGAFAEDPGESGGVPTAENGALPPLADPDGAASTFAAETADTDAGVPAPHTLMEAKHSHDRPPWEEPTESPVTHKARTAAQGLSQMGGVDIDDPDQSDHRGRIIHLLQPAHTDATFPRYQLADHNLPPLPVDHLVHPLTDPAPASAAECAITHDVPHRKAANTSSWAALSACPATTLTDANGSMAVYRRAKLGHTSPIDGGTMAPFSRRKEDAPLPTIRSAHDTTTHGSQEASRLCSPVSGASVNLKAPAPPFSDSHAAIAFKRDHQYHPLDPLGHQEREPPSSCAADDTVADAPTPLLPAEEKHFATSPGPRTK